MTNSLDSRESEWTDEAPKARFWKRYSPHHEASISGSSSIVLPHATTATELRQSKSAASADAPRRSGRDEAGLGVGIR